MQSNRIRVRTRSLESSKKKRQVARTVVRSVTMGYSKKETDVSKACKSRGNDLRVHFKVRAPSRCERDDAVALRACALQQRARLLRLRPLRRAQRAEAGLRRPTLGFSLREAPSLTLPSRTRARRPSR